MYSVGEGYSQSAVSATWSEDYWSWSTHGNLIVVCTAMKDQQQAVHNGVNLCMMVEVASGKLSVHKRHSYTPETQLMIWAWSLVHANVAALAGEMTGNASNIISVPGTVMHNIFTMYS